MNVEITGCLQNVIGWLTRAKNIHHGANAVQAATSTTNDCGRSSGSGVDPGMKIYWILGPMREQVLSRANVVESIQNTTSEAREVKKTGLIKLPYQEKVRRYCYV